LDGEERMGAKTDTAKSTARLMKRGRRAMRLGTEWISYSIILRS
jgi:hypothetical protein